MSARASQRKKEKEKNKSGMDERRILRGCGFNDPSVSDFHASEVWNARSPKDLYGGQAVITRELHVDLSRISILVSSLLYLLLTGHNRTNERNR